MIGILHDSGTILGTISVIAWPFMKCPRPVKRKTQVIPTRALTDSDKEKGANPK
jgi:hypothetical protein